MGISGVIIWPMGLLPYLLSPHDYMAYGVITLLTKSPWPSKYIGLFGCLGVVKLIVPASAYFQALYHYEIAGVPPASWVPPSKRLKHLEIILVMQGVVL